MMRSFKHCNCYYTKLEIGKSTFDEVKLSFLSLKWCKIMHILQISRNLKNKSMVARIGFESFDTAEYGPFRVC